MMTLREGLRFEMFFEVRFGIDVFRGFEGRIVVFSV